MKNWSRAWLAAGLAALVFDARGGWAEELLTSREGPPPPQQCTQPAPVLVGAAGMDIYRNPVTGAFEAPPPDVAAQMPAPPAQPPLVERMGITPGGGVLLDHVPMMGMTATVDGTGRVATRCDHEPAHGEREP
jgi:hypothetical protein